MTLILDSGGITALAGNRARLSELLRRGEWPPIVPGIVLVEALTGDHRRDFHENRMLRTCDIRPVDEGLARTGARLRGLLAEPAGVSAADAVVAATAVSIGATTILTSDPTDLSALLVDHPEVRISRC